MHPLAVRDFTLQTFTFYIFVTMPLKISHNTEKLEPVKRLADIYHTLQLMPNTAHPSLWQ